MGIIGAFLIFTGVIYLRTYLQHKRWPVVEGMLDSVNLKITPSGPTELVGFFFNQEFIHKIRYSYRDHPYIIEISKKEPIAENLKLKVNPEKPYIADLDDESAFFPLLAITIGIILILISIKIGTNGTE